MNRTYVCAFPGLDEGKIVVAASSPGPGWYLFDPGELEGVPRRIPVPPYLHEEPGQRLYHYRVEETGALFFLSCRASEEEAEFLPVEGSGRPADLLPGEGRDKQKTVYERPDREARPPDGHLGIPREAGFIRWHPGRAKPVPPKPAEEIDILRRDDGVDILRRGME